jgi:Cu-Zn family superoxide dismutase
MNRIVTIAVAGALAAGCGAMQQIGGGSGAGAGNDGQRAIATLEPTKGNNAGGTVTFTQQAGKVLVNARVSGLKPNTEHGFHVHEKGDCTSKDDGTATGGHFNPDGKAHGAGGGAGPHHAGDMPNLKADASGNASASFSLATMAVGGGGPTDIVGKGLIVHAQPDDYKTQPTGNAGARIACAVIR